MRSGGSVSPLFGEAGHARVAQASSPVPLFLGSRFKQRHSRTIRVEISFQNFASSSIAW